MTTNISEEELLLRKRARRRLVGAVVLVVVAVIILPVIFDEPKLSHEKQEIVINLPPIGSQATRAIPDKNALSVDTFDEIDPSLEFQNKIKAVARADDEISELPSAQKKTPIPGIKPKFVHQPSAVSRNVTPAAVSQPAVPVSVPQPAAAAPVVSAAPPPAAVLAPAQTAESGKGFIIQLGAYSDQAKAKQQQTHLASNGFKVYTEVHNDIMRVRIGPFATRAAADDEIKKLKKIGLDGVIIPR
ncbi:MAG: SPOR domain-containing protein [Nitrosomonas sp.]|nr:MAG: SPOR domain-containing protein [Nitrosomonas sp.]